MPKKISEETKAIAMELRSHGDSYESIAYKLGLSVSWCQHNLKSAQAEKKGVIDALEQKSKSKRGVSKGEIAKAIDHNQSKVELKREIKNVSRRIKKRSKENIVRPNWMPPEFSVFVTEKVMSYSNEMERRLQEYAEEILCDLAASCTEEEEKNLPSALSLKFAMASLLCTMTNPSSAAGGVLTNMTNSLYDTALQLEKRNGNTEVSVTVSKAVLLEDMSDLDDIAY